MERIKASPEVRKLYRALLLHQWLEYKFELMSKLADALEDCGSVWLAAAYRWAAENQRWPFKRRGRYHTYIHNHIELDPTNPGDNRGVTGNRQVYDWQPYRSEKYGAWKTVSTSAFIPMEIGRAIQDSGKRKYGGPNRAFILLASAFKRMKRVPDKFELELEPVEVLEKETQDVPG